MHRTAQNMCCVLWWIDLIHDKPLLKKSLHMQLSRSTWIKLMGLCELQLPLKPL